jgi:HTH-type transcriptional regulator/antitoxin HigA
MNENPKPARLVPPGALLKRELDARGWSQRDLADIMKRPAQAISEIVQGTKQITPETAIELAEALGTSAEFWTNLESRFRLQLAQRKRAKLSTKDKISRKARLYALVPVKELLKRRWIKRVSSIEALEKEVCRLLEIKDLEQRPQLAASFRQSQARTPQSGPQLAWIKRVEAVAKKQKVGPFSRARLEQSLPELLKLMDSPEHIPDALEKLNVLGVRVALVEHLPQSYVDGAAFTLDDNTAVIALSLRYNRIDNFWFTLLHEIAHLVSKHRGARLDNFEERGKLDAEEQEANTQAQNWIFPSEHVEHFVKKYRGRFSRAVINEFATRHGRHPGLLVGQLHHRKVVPYSNFREMLVPVRSYLEGWQS